MSPDPSPPPAGISVRNRVFADEDALPEEKLVDHIVPWPRKWPRGSRDPMEPGAGRRARAATKS